MIELIIFLLIVIVVHYFAIRSLKYFKAHNVMDILLALFFVAAALILDYALVEMFKNAKPYDANW